eukprot:2972398-Prymnesium_polylepis.2
MPVDVKLDDNNRQVVVTQIKSIEWTSELQGIAMPGIVFAPGHKVSMRLSADLRFLHYYNDDCAPQHQPSPAHS